MAVTSAMVGYITKGRWHPGDSDAEFVHFKTIAMELLDRDNPGLSTTMYDHCHALMMAHLYFARDYKTGMRSFSTGDFSGSQEPGVTIYLIEYQQILKDFQPIDLQETDIETTRCDAVMDEFKLDQSESPSFFSGGIT